VSLNATIAAEPIAGYTLTEQIGVGGYGEVWKAGAPGGLTKAVKLVFGRMQDQWATCELRSLRRIKEVRHPFLLSLERIEVVDGQLVIVTELADGSLKDRYAECRRSGLPGIPRDELLAALSDAAEALDYMREKFSLQHLDVKPENLLIVGGRVKVGDFGLVSDIMDPQRNVEAPAKRGRDGDPATDREAVLPALGGLTPLYAAPELFDGQPSIHSDQYSLAIVYQELLTGVLPFPGETPEQLAAQHRSAAARVTPLPPADRPTITRALDKDPRKRFGSCRELIAALCGSANAGVHPSLDTDLSHFSSKRHADTAVAGSFAIPTEIGVTLPRANTIGPTGAPAPIDFDAIPEPMSVADLPAFEIAGKDQLRPTLWLGMGGTAATVLLHLRRRLVARFGDPAELPALQMLLVDTDRETVARATQEGVPHALKDHEAILTPLRKSQDYHERSEEYLRWLSRRWLYNIPFSGRTEGFRPLGRLAFVDHLSEISKSLQTALKLMNASESLETTAKTAGMEFADRTPRVFLIASVSGGTGGGMAFDMAHLVRRISEHLGLPSPCVNGLFTHSTGRVAERKTLAIADAYAWLREWQYWQACKGSHEMAGHWSTSGDGHAPPLSQTYLVHLGDEIGEHDLDRAADDLAAYLYLDAATVGGEFFDRCRRPQDSPADPQRPVARLRTLGICQVSLPCEEAAAKRSDLTHEHHSDRRRRDVQKGSAPTSSGGREQNPAEPRIHSLSNAHIEDLLPLDSDGERDNSLLAGCLDLLNPRLLVCGGARRLLLVAPDRSVTQQTQESLAKYLRCAATIITRSSGETIFCCEAEDLDADRVATFLIGQRRDCARMALRLHTRIDIPWMASWATDSS
jgi:eukaryotic-like serine/threonine-protein kinase